MTDERLEEIITEAIEGTHGTYADDDTPAFWHGWIMAHDDVFGVPREDEDRLYALIQTRYRFILEHGGQFRDSDGSWKRVFWLVDEETLSHHANHPA
jgi:hypothetical protein